MVTVNLLPWRPLSRHYRAKILRRLTIGLIAATLLLTGLITLFFFQNKTPAIPTLKPLPPPPVDPHIDAVQKAWQLQQLFLSILHDLDCILHPGLRLTQMTIMPASVHLRGQSDSLNAWLGLLSALLKNWTVQINDLQRVREHGQSFSLTIMPRTQLLFPPDSHRFFEIKSHTSAIQKMLSQLPYGLLLEIIHPSANDDTPSLLQISGTFAKLIRFSASLHGNSFFCAADKMVFERHFTDIRLIYKWHFPCFGRHHPAAFHYVSKTNPFNRSPFPDIYKVSQTCDA